MNKTTLWLSISAGVGPEECAHAVALTLQFLLRDAQVLTSALKRPGQPVPGVRM
jgi:hypothetical protein